MEPRLQDFVKAARQSVATGVDVRLDKSGQPQVASRRNVWGRLVNWIRGRVFPNRRQAENMRVLHKLDRVIRQEFPDVPAKDRRSVIRRAAVPSLPQRILATARGIRETAGYRPGQSLDEEINETLRLGFASDVVRASGDTALPDDEFRNLVAKFNETMSDLHRRFPRLRYIPPPILSQELATSPTAAAEYEHATRVIRFRRANLQHWDRRISREISKGWIAPKAPGIAGVISHEYGHHLSFVRAPRPWFSELVAALKNNGISVTSRGKLPTDAEFSKAIQGHLAGLGVGRYAGANPREFQAEVLAWYMSPTYGQPGEPRMPVFLEDWVRDSFPWVTQDSANASP